MKHFFLTISCLFVLGSAHAGNGATPETLKFHQWGKKPSVVTVISDELTSLGLSMRRTTVLYGWLDMSGKHVEPQQTVLCELAFPGNPDRCKKMYVPNDCFIVERYLGPADGFKPPVRSTKEVVGAPDFSSFPPGAVKVIVLDVRTANVSKLQVVSVAYEDISNEDLRQIALEEGVYRALKWREE